MLVVQSCRVRSVSIVFVQDIDHLNGPRCHDKVLWIKINGAAVIYLAEFMQQGQKEDKEGSFFCE